MNAKICRNCGKSGHINKNCTEPITSYGIILINKLNIIPTILFIQRKNTIGYIEFIFGKYNMNNKKYIEEIIKRMTISEFDFIKNNCFDDCWGKIYDKKTIPIHLKKKYNLFKTKYDLTYFKPAYNYTEWEFPKGRRNNNETDITCAIREFNEETNINIENIEITDNIIEENYISNNNNNYRHIYYIAYLLKNIQLNKLPCQEVLMIKWLTVSDGVKYIRDYSLKKKEIVNKVGKLYI